MTWAVTYVQDTEKPGCGTASATDSIVTHARRLDTNDGQDIDKFLAECTAKRAEHDKMAGDSAAVIQKIEAVLNGA